MWGSISSATGCAMNGMGWLRTAGSLVTFKARLDHHLRNVRGFFYSAAFLSLFIAILDITRHAGWQYGKRNL